MRVTGRFGIAITALAAMPLAAAGPRPLFSDDNVIHLSVTGHLPINSAATDATLGLVGGTNETLPVKLTLRGITRRAHDICSFPPLRIEFAQKPSEASFFRGQKKLKLVTHCRSAPAFQQYLLAEYAAYRMYEELTPLSFRVRLATIDYAASTGKPPLTRLGFLIEDVGEVAKRNNLEELKGADGKTPDKVPAAASSSVDAGRYAMFQYMIGNLDWAMNAGPAGAGCCHNSKLIGAKGATSNLVPVPYDFDFAGLVGAPYAAPPADVNVSSVRTRYYRGYCRDDRPARSEMDFMLAHRAALIGVIDAVPHLDEAKRASMKAYLATFFDQIADPDERTKLLRTCLH